MEMSIFANLKEQGFSSAFRSIVKKKIVHEKYT